MLTPPRDVKYKSVTGEQHAKERLRRLEELAHQSENRVRGWFSLDNDLLLALWCDCHPMRVIVPKGTKLRMQSARGKHLPKIWHLEWANSHGEILTLSYSRGALGLTIRPA